MNYCIQCILPETRPGLVIDNKGVCSACRGHEDKERSIDWSARSKMFDSIVKRAKETSRDYQYSIALSCHKFLTGKHVLVRNRTSQELNEEHRLR